MLESVQKHVCYLLQTRHTYIKFLRSYLYSRCITQTSMEVIKLSQDLCMILELSIVISTVHSRATAELSPATTVISPPISHQRFPIRAGFTRHKFSSLEKPSISHTKLSQKCAIIFKSSMFRHALALIGAVGKKCQNNFT